MESIHLIGVEQVQAAASIMRASAETMVNAANTIYHAMEKHGLLMRELIDELNLNRLEMEEYEIDRESKNNK